ncbi:MAG: N-acetylmannosamine-6-phosphate 2-epimerase [Arachnia sp.]
MSSRLPLGRDDSLGLEAARGKLIISCQAYPGEPMNDRYVMTRVALAAERGGAAAIRAQGVADVSSIAQAVSVPVIGLWKEGVGDVFITPTLNHALAIVSAGATVVAMDGTRRKRPDGLSLSTTITRLKQHSRVEVMADCGSLADAQASEAAGADYLGTTLAGYTGERPRTEGPDLELVAQIATSCSLPVVAEGRFRTAAEVRAALDMGAFSVCVGTAITHPQRLTERMIREVVRSS